MTTKELLGSLPKPLLIVGGTLVALAGAHVALKSVTGRGLPQWLHRGIVGATLQDGWTVDKAMDWAAAHRGTPDEFLGRTFVIPFVETTLLQLFMANPIAVATMEVQNLINANTIEAHNDAVRGTAEQRQAAMANKRANLIATDEAYRENQALEYAKAAGLTGLAKNDQLMGEIEVDFEQAAMINTGLSDNPLTYYKGAPLVKSMVRSIDAPMSAWTRSWMKQW